MSRHIGCDRFEYDAYVTRHRNTGEASLETTCNLLATSAGKIIYFIRNGLA